MYPTIFVGDKYQKLNRVYSAMDAMGLNPITWRKEVQPFDLQIEAWIDSSKGVISFQTRKGTNNTDNPDESRIDTNDLVFFDKLGLFVRKVDKSTTPYNYSNRPLYPYPDPNAFPGTKSGSVAEASALETVFGGSLTLKTGNITLFDSVKAARFRKLPDNPYAVATTSPVANAVHASFNLDNILYEFAQVFCLYGNQNYTFDLTFGTGDRLIADGSYDGGGTAIAALGTRNQLVLIAQGYKVVGGAGAALNADFGGKY